VPYTKGIRALDNIYLDTTFASGVALDMEFPTKADGIAELLRKVDKYSEQTTFYLDSWTFGYEEVFPTKDQRNHARAEAGGSKGIFESSIADEKSSYYVHHDVRISINRIARR